MQFYPDPFCTASILTIQYERIEFIIATGCICEKTAFKNSDMKDTDSKTLMMRHRCSLDIAGCYIKPHTFNYDISPPTKVPPSSFCCPYLVRPFQ
jgi:hypothetical protein